MTNIKTAAEYRQMAADCRRRSAESFERCDTDGFLSQWAADSMALRYDRNADRVERGGVYTTVLVEIATNQIISTDYREGQYGWYYLVRDDTAAERVGRFVTPSSARTKEVRDRNNAKKGVREVEALVPLADCYESRTGNIEPWTYENVRLLAEA